MAGATRARAMTMRRWFPAWALSSPSRGLRWRRWRRQCLGPSGALPAALVGQRADDAAGARRHGRVLGQRGQPELQLSLGFRRRQHQHRGRADPRLRARRRVRGPAHARQRRRLDQRRAPASRSPTSRSSPARAAIAAATTAGAGSGRCRRATSSSTTPSSTTAAAGRSARAARCSPPSTAASPGTRSLRGRRSTSARRSFRPPRAGWLTSEFGELLRTADGGASWRRVSYGRNDFVLALGASDADTAWLTTTLGAGFVTRDGGSSWRQVDPAPGGTFRLAFASATDVWSLPPFIDAQPTLDHSLDGGATWTTVQLPAIAAGFSGYSDDMLFVDALHALVTGFESGLLDPADPTSLHHPPDAAPHRRWRRLLADGAAAEQRQRRSPSVSPIRPRSSPSATPPCSAPRTTAPPGRRCRCRSASRSSPAFAPSAPSASSLPTSSAGPG